MNARAESDEDPRDRHGKCCQSAAAKARSTPLGEPVVQRSSQQAADQHRQKGQHGIESAGLQIESTHFRKIAIEPTEKYPRHVAVAKITDGNCPDFTASNHPPPGYKRLAPIFFCRIQSIIRWGQGKPGSNRRELGRRYSWMLSRSIARCDEPDPSSQ